jgi:hypothetical protein
MNEVSRGPLRDCDERTAVVVITSAFLDDPVERWLYPAKSSGRTFPGLCGRPPITFMQRTAR